MAIRPLRDLLPVFAGGAADALDEHVCKMRAVGVTDLFRDLRYGEIGIFLVDNEGYIKEYREDGLHSHNPAYRTMTFREDQSVRCIGRVIGKLKDSQIPTKSQLRMLDK